MVAARADCSRRKKNEEADAVTNDTDPATVERAPRLTKAAVGLVRPVIEGVRPQVDCGRYPAKASIGEPVIVEADIFCDGHDALSCEVRHRPPGARGWTSVAMAPLGNDRWRATFPTKDLGRHRFQVVAVIDRFASWRRDTLVKANDGQDVAVDLALGAQLLTGAAVRAKGVGRRALTAYAEALAVAPRGLETTVAHDPLLSEGAPLRTVADLLQAPELEHLLWRTRDLGAAAVGPELAVFVDPERARFSAWYELFPRSAGMRGGRHGTLAAVEARHDEVAAMGFDVVYLPPIHPIGTTNRKGADGGGAARRADPGSPWAIGAREGGHTAIHPELGTEKDLASLLRAARRRGIEVALDVAFQCSPDHPWVREHPSWFRHLPDGSIRYAENPPKRYEDIYPIDFETPQWRELWDELAAVVGYWIDQGITVFRVDNPHTKSLAFWEWLLAEVKAKRPEVIFLAEAFTRPRLMYRLAKIGFTQSYTYFTWREAKWELEQYMDELTTTEVADYFRPNFWPNTPDILPAHLQHGGRAAFLSRLVLAATLSSNYGIYGPAFELQEHVARQEGSEEYAHSEKYAIRNWDRERPDSLAGFIGRVNRIRHENPALHHNRTLRFHHCANDALLCYSKTWLVDPGCYLGEGVTHAPSDPNAVLVVVNLDPTYEQSGILELDLAALGLDPGRPFDVHDLLTDAHYQWQGPSNFVRLDPSGVPAHIFRVHHPEKAGAKR
jgi:starch synthase (maltosyl-transferring)